MNFIKKRNGERMEWINSVLVAGVEHRDNQLVRLCENYLLEVHHVPHYSSKPLPKCDVAIIAATAINHDLSEAVIQAYKGKNVYWSKGGTSSFKEQFDQDVFGQGTLKVLRSPPATSRNEPGALTETLKLTWVMMRFCAKIPQKRRDVMELYAALSKSDGNANGLISNVLHDYKSRGWTDHPSLGYFQMKGISDRLYKAMLANNLPADPAWVIDYDETVHEEDYEVVSNQKPLFNPIITPEYAQKIAEKSLEPLPIEPLPEIANIRDEDTAASINLLLDAMTQQEKQIDGLKSYIEKTIPALIQHEIRGITKLLGSLVPQLQGLTPEEIDQVQKMLDLFLGMRKMRSPDSEIRN